MEQLGPGCLKVVTEFFFPARPSSGAAAPTPSRKANSSTEKDAERWSHRGADRDAGQARCRRRRRRHHLQRLSRGDCLSEDEGRLLGLPSATATCRHGIENLLKHFLPDVQAVEAWEG